MFPTDFVCLRWLLCLALVSRRLAYTDLCARQGESWSRDPAAEPGHQRLQPADLEGPRLMNDQTVHAARVRGGAVAGCSVEGNVGPLTSQGKPEFENQVSQD